MDSLEMSNVNTEIELGKDNINENNVNKDKLENINNQYDEMTKSRIDKKLVIKTIMGNSAVYNNFEEANSGKLLPCYVQFDNDGKFLNVTDTSIRKIRNLLSLHINAKFYLLFVKENKETKNESKDTNNSTMSFTTLHIYKTRTTDIEQAKKLSMYLHTRHNVHTMYWQSKDGTYNIYMSKRCSLSNYYGLPFAEKNMTNDEKIKELLDLIVVDLNAPLETIEGKYKCICIE